MDWSARSAPSPRAPTKDAIFICSGRPGAIEDPIYCRTRDDAMALLRAQIDAALARDKRLCIGFDFAFGYPRGFAQHLTGQADAPAVWQWLAEHIEDDSRNANNRFEVANKINARFPGVGPFWGHPSGRGFAHLPERGTLRHSHGMPERRAIETCVGTAQPCWKLFTTGSVGSQSLLGLPRIAALRAQYGENIAVWPMDTGWRAPHAAISLVEIYPSFMTPKDQSLSEGEILDAAQVRWVVQAILAAQEAGQLHKWFAGNGCAETAREEGWIFGVTPDKVPS
ncbi:molybdopterin guanine dinucleotide synthesis [Primorskyibacter sp. S187A]|uniref:molybdopterin guanine dinucleotide synthesis n=1 Tax=Primorskyibacter sp. S187A TaxID=3415130 RepID=UPI003C7BC14A